MIMDNTDEHLLCSRYLVTCMNVLSGLWTVWGGDPVNVLFQSQPLLLCGLASTVCTLPKQRVLREMLTKGIRERPIYRTYCSREESPWGKKLSLEGDLQPRGWIWLGLRESRPMILRSGGISVGLCLKGPELRVKGKDSQKEWERRD